jgi:hypothetical protein
MALLLAILTLARLRRRRAASLRAALPPLGETGLYLTDVLARLACYYEGFVRKP